MATTRRIVLTAAAAAIATGALYFGVRWVTHGRFIQHTDNAYIKADTVNISAKVPGRIEAVLVEENALVKAGDPVFRLESSDYAAQMRQAEAEAAARRAALHSIQMQILLADARVTDAEGSIKSAKATLSLQQLELQRAADLARENFATRRTLDQATASVTDWSGRYQSATAGLDAAKASAGVIAAQEEEAVAMLAKAEAALDLARINLENTVIRASASGVAGNLSGRKGQYVTPGQRLVSIVPIEDVYVVANFKETQIRRINPGDKVELKIDAYPGLRIDGEVDNLAPASGAEFSLLPPENATGNFTKIVQRMPVRIRITHAPATAVLLPGLSVTAEVDTRGGEEIPTALFAPRVETDAALARGGQ
ncbi:MAG: HlyD family secretion protein [Parvularculaceae bacterium]|nr:HlyD family secretion protein [Parvularculaceae bacterium]